MCDYCNYDASVTYCQLVDAPTISLSRLRTVKKKQKKNSKMYFYSKSHWLAF